METTETKDTSLGFPQVAGGTYVWEIMDNIKIIEGKETESISHSIGMRIDSVVNGDGHEGDKASWMINVITGKGDDNRMADTTYQKLLTAAGCMKDLADKSKGEDVDVTSDKFMAFIKAKLPGRFIEATHQVKDKNMNFTDVRAISGKDAPMVEGSKEDKGGDDW